MKPLDRKSYALYSSLNPILSFNPIHWGIIFIAGLLGCYIRIKNGHQGNSVIAFAAIVGVFAISYALSDGGSQTRALLYPILAIHAGGLAFVFRIWTSSRKRPSALSPPLSRCPRRSPTLTSSTSAPSKLGGRLRVSSRGEPRDPAQQQCYRMGRKSPRAQPRCSAHARHHRPRHL